jgi:hypothetical protein
MRPEKFETVRFLDFALFLILSGLSAGRPRPGITLACWRWDFSACASND